MWAQRTFVKLLTFVPSRNGFIFFSHSPLKVIVNARLPSVVSLVVNA